MFNKFLSIFQFESIMGLELAQETVWFDKWRYDDAEAKYYEQKFGVSYQFYTFIHFK